MGLIAATTGPPQRKRPPLRVQEAASENTKHQCKDDFSASNAQGQAPKNLTSARLSWLQHCHRCDGDVDLALCALLAECAGWSASAERFKSDGVLTAYPSYWTMAKRLRWEPHEVVRELERLERAGLVQTTANRYGAPQYELVCGRPAEKPTPLAEQLDAMLKGFDK